MKDESIRSEIIRIAREFNTTGLSAGSSGNISVLTGATLLITPTRIPYYHMAPADLVVLDMEGAVVSGDNRPSTEWHFHCGIYRQRTDAGAVVHVHSPYATAVSCVRQDIPAFHYLVAGAGGDSIRCSEYATFGTEALSRNAIIALKDRKACLLANHGMIAIGPDLQSAYRMAQAVEELAKHYCLSRQIGEPVLLDREEIKRILEKFRTYNA